jgi:hypothetical protein
LPLPGNPGERILSHIWSIFSNITLGQRITPSLRVKGVLNEKTLCFYPNELQTVPDSAEAHQIFKALIFSDAQPNRELE